MLKEITRVIDIPLTPREKLDMSADIVELDGKMMAVEKRRKAIMISSLNHVKKLKEKQHALLEVLQTGCKKEEVPCPMEWDFNAKVKRIMHPLTMEVLETLPLSDEDLQIGIEDDIEGDND